MEGLVNTSNLLLYNWKLIGCAPFKWLSRIIFRQSPIIGLEDVSCPWGNKWLTYLVDIPFGCIYSIDIALLFNSHRGPLVICKSWTTMNHFTRGIKPVRGVYLDSRLVSWNVDSVVTFYSIVRLKCTFLMHVWISYLMPDTSLHNDVPTLPISCPS